MATVKELQSQISSLSRAIDENSTKIAKLKSAQKQLINYKNNLTRIRDLGTKSNTSTSIECKGKRFKEITQNWSDMNKAEEVNINNLQEYIDKIENKINELNDDIRSCNSSIRAKLGMINKLSTGE